MNDARQRGHTLLELAVAMALGLLVVLATISLYRGQRHAFERATETARLHDAAMTALDLIGQPMQMAGFAAAGQPHANNPPPLFGCAKARQSARTAHRRARRCRAGRMA